MMRFVIILLLVFPAVASYGQDEPSFQELADRIRTSTYFDSSSVFKYGKKAIAIAEAQNDPAKKGRIYQHYGNFNFYSGRLDRAAKYYDTTLFLALESADTTLLHATKIRQNFIALEREELTVVQNTFTELLEHALRRNDFKNAIECYNGLAIIHERKHDKGKALEYYLKAYGYADTLDNNYLKGMLLNNIGLIKFKNDQIDGALTDFKKGVELAAEIDNFRLSFNLENNIGLLYDKTEAYKKSIDHFKKTLKNAHRLGFPYNIAVTHLNLSNGYAFDTQNEEAMAHADSALQIFRRIDAFQHVAKPYFIKAQVARNKNDHATALVFLDTALNLSRVYDNEQDLIESYEQLSETHKALNNFEQSLEHYEHYVALRDSIDEITNQERFAQLQVIYATEKKEAELKEQRARTNMLEKENRLKQSKIILITIVGSFLVLATIVFFYLRHLRLSRAQQKKFSQQLIESLDQERLRISRDLHDDIGQSLSVAKSKINLFKKGQLPHIDNMEERLGEIIQHARALSHQLHPSYLEKIGLKRSLKSLLERTEEDTGIVCSTEISNRVDELSLRIQSQLYRIAQECLNNTVKHAGASAIKISIAPTVDGFEFIYRDNGKGFDPNNEELGLGMMTIRERSEKMGAKYAVNSRPGRGFKLIVNIKSP